MGFLQAMKKVFVVSLASQKSETTHAANLVLPALTAYESWGDAFPSKWSKKYSTACNVNSEYV
ncbi:MAG: hypothetical protein Ct9H300mP21_08630 [Pseudomonadota bacterium]|nr:MAG: hypothetical protein Ct9H300mP21_08630 [Pseudomonadota bacterium]